MPSLAGEQMRSIDKLIVMVFRLSGSLLEGGSRLVEDIGLTPAWWQVLGALHLSPVPLTVPQIARNIGLTRQSVQRIVDLLIVKQFLQLESNPHHRRAKLVVMSDAGKVVFLEAERRQRPWAANLAAGLSKKDLDTAIEVLKTLDEKLSD